MVAVLSNLYGRISGNEKQPERRTTGGGQSGSRTFSDRNPTPKPIGGPLTNLGKAATSFALFPPLGILGGLGGLFEGGRQVSGDVQEVSGKTQEALGKLGKTITSAPGAVIGGVTAPVGQLSKDILPLAAIAAAIVLLR
tara:strand:- start:1782 stop:2198 length:417 start_codon:yes stop_codon:yes gene_type:complete